MTPPYEKVVRTPLLFHSFFAIIEKIPHKEAYL